MTTPLLAGAAIIMLACPALAATPYMASVSDAACNKKSTCVLTFPAPASMLTIQHVSCGILTKGNSGSVSSVMLSTTATAAATPGDYLTVGALLATNNIQNTANVQTLFYVAANDQPTISISSETAITASTGAGCLITGTLS